MKLMLYFTNKSTAEAQNNVNQTEACDVKIDGRLKCNQ